MLYLDDHFPEHPKIADAGGDAGWLWIAAACWVKRHKTGGRVPKSVLAQLTDRRNPKKLAERLVDVELWHDDGDAFVFHDWANHNWSEERAKKAAHARWGPPGDDAQASPSIMLEGRSADAPAGGRARAPRPRPPSSNSSSSTHDDAGAPLDDDDLRSVWDLLADRRIAALGQQPSNPRAYRRTVLANVAADHRGRATELQAEIPTVTSEQLADMLEPPVGPPAAPIEDAAVRARRERDELLVARERTPCPHCDAGFRWGDGGEVVACESCGKTGVAAHA